MPSIDYDCEQCGERLRVRLGERVVICRYCGAEQRWAPPGEEAVPAEPPRITTEPSRGKRLTPIPERLRIDDDGSRLLIRRRWFVPAVLFLVFFCIAWDSFLVFWYTMALGGGAPWIMLVFPVVHLAVGVGLTYLCVAVLFNTTTIRVDRHELRVTHGPVPWKGNRRIPARDVQQLFCTASLPGRSSRRSASVGMYEVSAVDRSNRKIKLVPNLNDVTEALAIEQTVERYLGIEDEAVAGEVQA